MNIRVKHVVALMFCAILGGMLTSCMHLAMGGHAGAGAETAVPLEKEATVSGFILKGKFPVLNVGEESKVELSVSDASRNLPAARITAVTGRFDYGENSMTHMMDDRKMMQEETVEPTIITNENPGRYSFLVTPRKDGQCTLGFRIKVVDSTGREQELSLETSRTVAMAHSSSGGGMMGMGMSSTTLVLGVVAMGAMMAIMLLWR